MSVSSYNELKQHVGHKIVCVTYGNPEDPENVALECEDCNCVLKDYDRGQKDMSQLEADIWNAAEQEDLEVNDDIVCGVMIKMEKYDYSRYNERICEIIRDLKDEKDEDKKFSLSDEEYKEIMLFYSQANFVKKEYGGAIWHNVDEGFMDLVDKLHLPAEDKDKLYIYTIVQKEDLGYLIEGYHLIGHLGHIFSRVYVPLKDGSMRYL